MVLARSSIRAFSLTTRSLARPSIGAASTTRPILQQLGDTGRRGYSDQTGGHEEKKSSDIPWLLGSIGLGGPAAYYLIQTGPEAKPHHGHDHATPEGQVHHEENTEQEEEEAQSEPAASPEAKEPEESAAREVKKLESSNQKPSEVDQAEAVKWPAGPSTTSGKQEAVSNDGTSNPFTTAPGTSVKGESDVDSAKLRGSVDTERPQV